jgi:predicted amidophosphoribosyltransferase
LLPDRLTWIDETNREQHAFLREGDKCLFFGEYQGREGYTSSRTNQLIFNFKCPPTTAAQHEQRRYYKTRAIQTIGMGLRRAISREQTERLTWVPIPPSKAVGDPDYDDRLSRALAIAFNGYDVDVRLLLKQTQSTEADHVAGERLTRDKLLKVLEVDEAALDVRPLRQKIILFDDVLTSGKHFKCCEERLRDVVPDTVPIIGVFVARCVFPAATADEFEVIEPGT